MYLDLLFRADDDLVSARHVRVLDAGQLTTESTAEQLHGTVDDRHGRHSGTMLQLDLFGCSSSHNPDNTPRCQPVNTETSLCKL